MVSNKLQNAVLMGVVLTGCVATKTAMAASLSLVDATNVASSNISVLQNDTFSLFVRATGMPETLSGAVSISWLNGILQLDSYSLIPPYNTDFIITPPDVTSNSISNLSGSYLTFDPNYVYPNGDFNFAQLNFTALAPINGSPIDLVAIAGGGGWVTPFQTVISFDGVSGATLTVSAIPVPAAIWLFGSGLIGMMTIGRRRVQA